MPGPIICAKCGKIVSQEELEKGHHKCPKSIRIPKKPETIPEEKKHDSPQLLVCPHCVQKSLFLRENTNIYECLNIKCKRTFIKIIDNEILTTNLEVQT